ncbi:TIGR03915 family putative DNA repair protein [Xylophilus sp.]|uniref:TIGR03915 family putative DNA repair protein n=1 Tax=Xylophilus sp. TaxID=2653893 RepID=UPI0013B91E75|nr:TIGR03915 family putative DNA repair protein [Xylophilus sp.]KAF1045821.1 MAG: hypothetical protein GAK38_02808 [Xylophilus sp.]
MRTIVLPGPTAVDAFRDHARGLLAAGVAPESVEWQVAGSAAPELFAAQAEPTAVPPAPVDAARVPAAFVTLCRTVALHRDPGRFALLYRLLWRLVHEPALRHDPLDPDRDAAESMARAVRRDAHKMKAFVRFRPLPDADGREPLHIAWFEPDHHIVEAVAPFFARRFAAMRWAILTPGASVRWDGAQLRFGPGAAREDAPGPDAGEALWLTYYASIFNPARLKLDAMRKEMPRRYWHNLPEAALIDPLAAGAMERTGRMVDSAPTQPLRRIAGRQRD